MQLWLRVLRIIDLSHGLFSPQSLGQHARSHIQIFVGRNGYEQISIAHARLLQRFYTVRHGLHGKQIELGIDFVQPFDVLIY